MATQYTGLIFKVPSSVDIHKFRYDLIIKYKSGEAKHQRTTGNKILEYKNQNFNSQFMTLERQLPKGSIITINYLIKVNGKLVKNVSATPNKSKGVFREYVLKTTIAGTKKDPNTIKKVLVDTTEVGWIIIDKDYSIQSFLRKIYIDNPTIEEEKIFRANNPHLIGTPVLSLKPGDVAILSNTSVENDELRKMKKQAKLVKDKLSKLRSQSGFNANNFVSSIDAVQSIFEQSDYIGLTEKPIKSIDTPSTGANYGGIAKGTAYGIADFVSATNNRVIKSYIELANAMQSADSFKSGNPKHFKLFRQNNAALYKNFDNAFSQSMFRFNTGKQTGNIRRQLKPTAMMRQANYRGGIEAYFKQIDNVDKITKNVQRGGTLLVAVDVGLSAIEVKKAYNTGDSAHTRRTVVKETLKLEGSLGGAWLGATGASAGAGAALLVFGIGTGGVGLVVVGVCAVVGGFAGGLLGSMGGEALAEIINENT